MPCSLFGAGGGTRTHTMSPSTDFESVTSANSITPADGMSKNAHDAPNGDYDGYIVAQFQVKVKWFGEFS